MSPNEAILSRVSKVSKSRRERKEGQRIFEYLFKMTADCRLGNETLRRIYVQEMTQMQIQN